MLIFKKLIFALPLLLSLILLYQYIDPVLGNIYLIFSFDRSVLAILIPFLVAISLVSLFFVIFTTLADDWRLILPVALLGILPAILTLINPVNLVIGGGFLLSFGIIYLTLVRKLASYLIFKTNSLLIPSITQLSTLLLLVISIAFFLSADTKIKASGLEIPDSLIDPVINMSIPQRPGKVQSTTPLIPPEQLQFLKQNPALLKQYGLNPGMLDEIDNQNSPAPGQNLIKNEVKKQIQNLINPQIQLLAPAFAVLFFFTFKFGLSILSLVLFPLVWFIFWVMEKTGFVRFEIEQRPVKKLVV